MTLAAPWLAALGALAAAGVVLVHFIARAQPPVRDLPTARFVPAATVRAPALERRPSDPLLLALRALAVLLLALAVASPSFAPVRRPLARVVLLDRSRAVADQGDALRRAHAARADGDPLIAFDTAARVVPGDSALPPPLRAPRGSLAAALALAAREARRLAPRADALELVVVSPLVEEEWDAAASRLLALWPGGVRLERVAAATAAAAAPIAVVASPDDPLRATAALLGAAGARGARIVRTAPTAADSAAAAAGGVLVDWPADPARRLVPRATPDTAGAVVAGDVVVAAPFPRRTAAPTDDSAQVVARWVDGEAAATERRLGEGCVRQVAVPVTGIGDLALRASMQSFVRAMSAPCGGAPAFTPLPDSILRAGPAAGAAGVPGGAPVSRPLALLLLALAVLALVVEQVLRRRSAA